MVKEAMSPATSHPHQILRDPLFFFHFPSWRPTCICHLLIRDSCAAWWLRDRQGLEGRRGWLSVTWDPSAALPLNCSVTFTSVHTKIIEIRYKITLSDPVSPFHCQFSPTLLFRNAYAFCFVKFEMS